MNQSSFFKTYKPILNPDKANTFKVRVADKEINLLIHKEYLLVKKDNKSIAYRWEDVLDMFGLED